jgi:hypothetical protein
MRILLPILLILALIWWLRSRPGKPRGTPPTPPRQAHAQDMVVCQTCGVHLAVNEAVQVGQGRYVCPEHPTDTPH